MNDCLQCAPLVGSEADDLSQGEARALSAHLAACPACSARAADAAVMGELIREGLLAAAAAEAPGLADAVLERLARGAPLEGDPFEEPDDPDTTRRGARAWGKVRAFTLRHPFAVAVLAPAAVAAFLALVYLGGGSSGDRSQALVEVTSEGRSATVLETAEGPIVLLAEHEPAGS